MSYRRIPYRCHYLGKRYTISENVRPQPTVTTVTTAHCLSLIIYGFSTQHINPYFSRTTVREPTQTLGTECIDNYRDVRWVEPAVRATAHGLNGSMPMPSDLLIKRLAKLVLISVSLKNFSLQLKAIKSMPISEWHSPTLTCLCLLLLIIPLSAFSKRFIALSMAFEYRNNNFGEKYLPFCWVYASFNELYDEFNDTFCLIN